LGPLALLDHQPRPWERKAGVGFTLAAQLGLMAHDRKVADRFNAVASMMTRSVSTSLSGLVEPRLSSAPAGA
jgi:hypothetical protein